MGSQRLRSFVWSVVVFGSVLLSGCGGQQETQTEPEEQSTVVVPGFDPYCSTRPKLEFCEDFDTRDLPGIFDAKSVAMGTMEVDEEEAMSAPRSLLITVEPGGHGELTHQFVEKGGKLRFFGMLYVPELGKGEVELGSFALGNYRVGFGVNEDGTLWGYEGNKRFAGNGTIPVGLWASVRWDVNLYDDGTGDAQLRFGFDELVYTDELNPPINSTDAPSARVGLSNATGAWRIRFDSLEVSVKEATK